MGNSAKQLWFICFALFFAQTCSLREQNFISDANYDLSQAISSSSTEIAGSFSNDRIWVSDTLELYPTDDIYVEIVGDSLEIYDTTWLRAEHSNARVRVAYMRFDFSAVRADVQSAILELTNRDASDRQGLYKLHLGTHAEWNSGIQNISQLPDKSMFLASVVNISAKSRVFFDITGAIQSAQPLTLILSQERGSGLDVKFASNEDTDLVNRPRIYLISRGWLWSEAQKNRHHSAIAISSASRASSSSNYFVRHFLQVQATNWIKDSVPFEWIVYSDLYYLVRSHPREMTSIIPTFLRNGYTVLATAILPPGPADSVQIFGRTPFIQKDPTRPLILADRDSNQYDFWDHLDTLIGLTRKAGLILALYVAWGDKIMQSLDSNGFFNTTDQAYRYGFFLGERYRLQNHIVWILGGDINAWNLSGDSRAIWRAMAEGITDGVAGDFYRDGQAQWDNTILLYQPGLGHTSAEWFHYEPWLDANMLCAEKPQEVQRLTEKTLSYAYPKPVLNGCALDWDIL